MASTWDSNRIEEVGLRLLASEAKLRAASVILAPTCNIQRVSELRITGLIIDPEVLVIFQNPLGGRVRSINFHRRGSRSNAHACVPCHRASRASQRTHIFPVPYARHTSEGCKAGVLVQPSSISCKAIRAGRQLPVLIRISYTGRANDKEDGRMRYDSVLSERALREIYLMPFMLAQKYAQPWAIMTAYVGDLTSRRSVGPDDNQLQPRQWSLCLGERAPPTGYPPKGVELRRIDHE